ncbi:MAG: twin-arginine translocase TatA/TatE family subunit [Bacteroidaceae bacterium]|nr:twin-arginine translocase TatA/TatE family subunit [Bacteroidaceae bacterium]
MTPLFLGSLGAGEILLIALIVLLLFGGKKIPELMRGLGRGVRSFKEGMNEIQSATDDKPGSDNDLDNKVFDSERK